jgi:4-amino-4-deoxy-L-arabinose transferase-like glycosyltransferase
MTSILSPARPFGWAAAAYALALLLGFVSLLVTGAWTAGFSGADEPAHFLNSWFVASYVRDALGENPLAYATEFYLHYPKISIGHWPPAYYGLLAPLWWVAAPTPAAAFAVNLLVSALPALGVAALLLRLEGRLAALLGALLWAATPIALEGQAFFMLDQALAACAIAALIAWLAFTERQAWTRISLFAGLAALGILIKGNGWVIPIAAGLHLAFTGRWDLLRSGKLWAGAAAGAALVGPWYAATAGIAGDGFNYAPGLDYAIEALLFNLQALIANAGILGLMLAAAGAGMCWRAPAIPACVSLILATLVLQSLVPVDLDARYMAPALPALIVLIVAGAASVGRLVPAGPLAVAAALSLLLLLPGAAHLSAREAKAGLRMEEAAALASGQDAWVVDGGSGAEGAFIAAMAVRDPALQRYSVRASKLLAESDFMGSTYTLKFRGPQQVSSELRRLGIGGVVVAARPGVEEFAHTALLQAALRDPASGYRLAAELPHRGRPGATLIYRAVEPRTADAEAIRALGLPKKAQLASN